MENHRSLCPVNLLVEIVGDKWSLLILRDLMFGNKRYFSEFRNSEENIASNILTTKLNMLESKGLLSKRQDPAHKKKVIYSLTEKSIDLMPLIVEATIWSVKHEPVDLIKYKPAIDFIAAGPEAQAQLRKKLSTVHLDAQD